MQRFISFSASDDTHNHMFTEATESNCAVGGGNFSFMVSFIDKQLVRQTRFAQLDVLDEMSCNAGLHEDGCKDKPRVY